MIRDARVLQDDFLPTEIVHRDQEMNRLADALEPAVTGNRPEDVFITGPSGVGKTCIARYSLDELTQQTIDIDTQYVDCWQHPKDFRILYRILEGINAAVDIHRTTAADEMLHRLHDHDSQYIVILDEVDQLDSPDLLKQLYGTPNLSMILIANREREVVGQLDERLRSRLRNSVRVEFEKYTHDVLVDILAQRVEWGLTHGVVDRDQLARIADAAAGNARDAIVTLRHAAKAARSENADEITDAHIEQAIPDAKAAMRQKTLDSLTDDQRAVFDALEAADERELSPSDLYALYECRVDNPMSQRTVRTYLKKMEQYNLVQSEGSGPSRVYRVVD